MAGRGVGPPSKVGFEPGNAGSAVLPMADPDGNAEVDRPGERERYVITDNCLLRDTLTDAATAVTERGPMGWTLALSVTLHATTCNR